MLDGTKDDEYRLITPFFDARLIKRQYNFVMFQNGYSPTSPRIKRLYKGYSKKYMIYEGVHREVYVIHCGEIVEKFHMEHFKVTTKKRKSIIG